MKKIYLILIVSILSASLSKAQLIDPLANSFNFKTAIWQGAMLSQTMEGVITAKNLVVKTREAIILAQQTKETIDRLYQFQEQIQKDLVSILSVKDLEWMDVLTITGSVLGVSTDIKDYIPNIGEEQPLIEYLKNIDKPGHTDVNNLLRLFGPTMRDWVALQYKKESAYQKWIESNIPAAERRHLRSNFKRKVDDFLFNKMLIYEQRNQMNIKMAMLYKNQSDSLVFLANEMSAKLLIDGFFTMDQGARTARMNECRELIFKSVELKEKYITLMEKATQRNAEEKAFYSQYEMDKEILGLELFNLKILGKIN